MGRLPQGPLQADASGVAAQAPATRAGWPVPLPGGDRSEGRGIGHDGGVRDRAPQLEGGRRHLVHGRYGARTLLSRLRAALRRPGMAALAPPLRERCAGRPRVRRSVWRRVLAIKTSYDQRFRQLSPGINLMLRLLEQAFAEGVEAVDLLGEEARWKAEMTNESRICEDSFVFTRGLPDGEARLLLETWLKPVLRRHAPWLFDLKRRLVDGRRAPLGSPRPLRLKARTEPLRSGRSAGGRIRCGRRKRPVGQTPRVRRNVLRHPPWVMKRSSPGASRRASAACARCARRGSRRS